MSTKTSPWWTRVDFAGKHGTIWGAINLWLTTVTATTCERAFWNSPWYVAAGTGAGGFVLTLMWAAFRRRVTPPATVLYLIGCWAGAGTWAAWMLAAGPWTWESWGTGISILAGAVLAGGLIVALTKEHHPSDLVEATPAVQGAGVAEDGMTQGERNTLAGIWRERIDRMSGNPQPAPVTQTPGRPTVNAKPWTPRVRIEAIHTWKTGAGYTIEGQFTSGTWGLTELQNLCEKLAGEADLPWGCHITALAPGGDGRRAFHLRVNTKNMLLEDQPFPVTGGPWAILGGTPVGVEQTGDLYPIWFREKNAALYAAPGGGKTSGMQAAVCSLALTADAILVGIDATGGQLVNNAQNAYETGRAQHPMFSAVARSYADGERLARALVRINHVRKSPVYDYLKRRENATVLPIGAKVRRDELAEAARAMFPAAGDDERIVAQVMCVSDEPRQFTGRAGKEATLREWIMTGMSEARDGGVRYLFGFLGTTDTHVSQPIQDLVHTAAAGMLATDGQYAGVFGHHSGVKASSYPAKPDGSGKVPGVFFISSDPGVEPRQIRFFGHITPSVMDQVAIRASEIGTLPELDYVSELAANGFQADGTPWPAKRGTEMEEGDRWFWRDRHTNNPKPAADTTPAASAGPAPRNATAIMDELRAKVAQVEQGIDKRAAELMNDCADVPVDEAELSRIVEDWIATAADAAPADEPWRDRVLRAIREAGADGLQMNEITTAAGVHRSEVFKFIRPLVAAHKLWQPKHGFYAFPADDR